MIIGFIDALALGLDTSSWPHVRVWRLVSAFSRGQVRPRCPRFWAPLLPYRLLFVQSRWGQKATPKLLTYLILAPVVCCRPAMWLYRGVRGTLRSCRHQTPSKTHCLYILPTYRYALLHTIHRDQIATVLYTVESRSWKKGANGERGRTSLYWGPGDLDLSAVIYLHPLGGVHPSLSN